MATLAILGKKDGVGLCFQVPVIVKATSKFVSLKSLEEMSFSSLSVLFLFISTSKCHLMYLEHPSVKKSHPQKNVSLSSFRRNQ